jgi:HSP20 family molecular chaperone IbpA
MDRIFDSLFYNFPKEIKPPVCYQINKDEKGTVKDITLQLAVAGFEEEDLKIWNEDNVLFLEGDNTKREEVLSKFRKSFSWKLPTADHIDLDSTKISFKNGLLTLSIPIKIPAKKRKYLLGKQQQ